MCNIYIQMTRFQQSLSVLLSGIFKKKVQMEFDTETPEHLRG